MLPHDTKRKIKTIITRKVVTGVTSNLFAARNLLCSGFKPDRTVKTNFEGKFLIKERQATALKNWAVEYGCWLPQPPPAEQYLTRGGGALVYQD